MPALITGGLGTTGGGAPLLTTLGLGRSGTGVATSMNVVSATVIGPSTIRVKFGDRPRLGNRTGFNDGLNPVNYVLAGPLAMTIDVVQGVATDRTAVDVFTTAPLDAGSWTITVSNVISVDAEVLSAPTSADFTVTARKQTTGIDGGAKNDHAAEVLRRHLNPALRGPAWDSLLAAIGSGEQKNWDNAKAGFDQFFLASASGEYLVRRAGERGIQKPAGVGLTDDAFRRLAIALGSDRLTQKALYDILEIFYSSDATRAAITTDVLEPFTLREGDHLDLLFGEHRAVRVEFNTSDFARIARANAVEVAAVINRALKAAEIKGIAVAAVDPTTGKNRVTVYADARGTASSIRVTGGRAQLGLQFPTALFPLAASPFGSWTITPSPTTPGRLRFSTSATTAYDLSKVQEGDFVVVSGQEFDDDAWGSHTIQAVSVTYPGGTLEQWFEIAGEDVNQVAVSQLGPESIAFFRPTMRTIYDQPRRALVTQASGELELVLPVTTQVVARGAGKAAYLHKETDVVIASATRGADGKVTVTTTGNHGLLVGEHVLLDGVKFGTALPSVTAGTPSTALTNGSVRAGQTDAQSTSQSSTSNSYASTRATACVIGDFVLFIGGRTQGAGSTAAVDRPSLFRVTSESNNNAILQCNYEWRRPNVAITAHNLDARAVTLIDQAHAGRVLLTGGHTNGTDATNATTLLTHRLLPAETVLLQTIGTMATARSAHGASVLADGKVLVTGGSSTGGSAIASAERWNPGTETWSAAGTMFTARCQHAQVGLPNGKVLVVGGRNPGGALDYEPNNPATVVTQGTVTNQCEIYDPASNTWAKTGQMSFARYGHAAVLLPNGKVLVCGGYGKNPSSGGTIGALDSAELYDPVTGFWQPAGKMITTRGIATAVYSSKLNAVVVAGGDTPGIDLYMLDTARWRRSLGSLGKVRRGCYAMAVPNSNAIVIAGGAELTGGFWQTTETSYVFVPGSETVIDGQAAGVVKVTSIPSSTIFTYQTSRGAAGSATVTGATPVSAPAGGNIPGPYILDPEVGVPVTAIEEKVAAQLDAGRQHTRLRLQTGLGNLSPATKFPDAPGWLVFSFGYANQVGPVRYLGRLSGTELKLDASHTFAATIAAGATVTLLKDRTPFMPPSTDIGLAYITASSAGRVAATSLAKDVAAGGIPLKQRVEYPGDWGLGGGGHPTSGADKLSDIVAVYAGDDIDAEVQAAREEVSDG